METGYYDESSLDADFPPEDEWRPSMLEEPLKPLRNAHKIHRGEHLPYTNYCFKVKRSLFVEPSITLWFLRKSS